jgi:phosphoribosylamine--glycine ligase
LLNVMVVGGGAREHTLAWKLLQSERVTEVYVAPGNAGTAAVARNLDISANDLNALARAAKEHKIGLVVVGPEAPLAAGIVDILQDSGILAFGPTGEAALIESSKVFAKRLMHKYGIPCAKDAVFSSFNEASDYVKKQTSPLVIKADGLAAGKGAIVAQSTGEALKALSDIMEARVFGDGVTVVPIVPARDYKRAFDNDLGPNTGGMGCYSPLGFFDHELTSTLTKTILEPAVRAMAQEGKPYKGVLYAGLMLTSDGPRVLEFNARFGDPETQVQLPLLKSDLVDIMLAVIDGTLDRVEVEWNGDACVGVVMASGGYPGSHKVGFPITGLDGVDPGLLIFHAGTKVEDGKIRTAGGRVLTVVAVGESVAAARERVYRNLPLINFDGCHYRKDIAAGEA